jgi:hypothetical protein
MEERVWSTNAVYAIVISSCLATGSALQQGSLERRLAIDAYQFTDEWNSRATNMKE